MNAGTATVSTRQRLAAIPGEALLALVLKLDAVTTGANGIAYVALADTIHSSLGVSGGALRAIGAVLVAYGVAVWLLASRPAINRTGVRVVIAANAIWAIDSAIVLIAGWLDPEALGAAWIALQAVIVAGYAAMQAVALRRAG
jgi:hypothetical protein